MRRNLLITLITFILLVPVVEIFLKVVDPLGIHAQMQTILGLLEGNEADPRGYALASGEHRLGGWTATMDDERNRVIPDETTADCKIAIMGDSVAFGFGVDDDETWLNILAAEITDAEFINRAMTAYNHINVKKTLENTTADGYVYVVIGNDIMDDESAQGSDFDGAAEAETVADQVGQFQYWLRFTALSGIYSHLRWTSVVEQTELAPLNYDSFDTFMQEIVDRDDILIVGFTGYTEGYEYIEENYPQITMFPPWESRLSWADPHASVAGNVEIADDLRAPITEFVNQICLD